MKLGLRLLSCLGFLVGLALLAACGGAESGLENDPAETQGEGAEELMVNRIAFIDNNGDLFLINPDATGEERLTGDVRAGLLAQSLDRGDSYFWPTWSRNGTRLAASMVNLGGSTPGLSVQVFDLESGGMVSAYDNEVPAPVADGTPHYIYWSPDSRYLTFLAPTQEGLALFARDYQSAGPAFPLAVGGPLYYHWSQDSGLLAVHSGDRVTLQEPLADAAATGIAVDAFDFRAPAISPDGSLMAYAGIAGGVQGVYLAPVGANASDAPRLLLETQGMSAFAWAPDGSSLAVGQQLRRGTPVFDRLSLVSPDGSTSSTIADEQLLAFFWSPQGDNIAWIGIDAQGREMDLAVTPVAAGQSTGETLHLFRFSPTGEVFTWFSFFDQYAYSHSIWSPDGSSLVVAGTGGAEAGRRNGSGPTGGQVFVVDVSTGESRRIASGKIAVWSWN